MAKSITDKQNGVLKVLLQVLTATVRRWEPLVNDALRLKVKRQLWRHVENVSDAQSVEHFAIGRVTLVACKMHNR